MKNQTNDHLELEELIAPGASESKFLFQPKKGDREDQRVSEGSSVSRGEKTEGWGRKKGDPRSAQPLSMRRRKTESEEVKRELESKTCELT